MKKSVYSLVLTDDVVAEIDRTAYEMNTSRSNLINQILAEYVSYVTPEKRMREVFKQLERLAAGNSPFQVLMQPSDSMFSLRSSLAYKYNPNIRYSVELYSGRHPAIGELRVSLRSQNSTLMLYMLQFFKLWTRIERVRLGDAEAVMEDGRYTRKLVVRSETPPDSDALGGVIADYINLFDDCLKRFFACLDNPNAAVAAVDELYAAYLRAHSVLL